VDTPIVSNTIIPLSGGETTQARCASICRQIGDERTDGRTDGVYVTAGVLPSSQRVVYSRKMTSLGGVAAAGDDEI